MLRWLRAFRWRLRDISLAALGLEQAWHSLPAFIAMWSALGLLFASMLANAAATHSKAVNTENRLNGVVNNVASLKSAAGTFAGFSGANQSQSMPGGMTITYNPSNSGNEGGTNSTTSGQIGGAAAHNHNMTHYHTESAALQSDFNLLQASFADICGRLNSMYTALQRAGIL